MTTTIGAAVAELHKTGRLHVTGSNASAAVDGIAHVAKFDFHTAETEDGYLLLTDSEVARERALNPGEGCCRV